MKLNRDLVTEYTKVLQEASAAWFYGYAWTKEDQKKLAEAMAYFEVVSNQLIKVIN